MDEMSVKSGDHKGRVLVVDDDPVNRVLLRDLLVLNGFRVDEAIDGQEALEKVSAGGGYDAILLDVMMPRLDGLQVCRLLKKDAATSHIPVLIISALSDRSQQYAGIDAGANDYLTKPIDRRDVVLRVRNAVQVKLMRDRVAQDMVDLKKLEQLRDGLTHMVVHDMRSPLMAIMGSLELLKDDLSIKPEAMSLWQISASAAQELFNMCNAILDISRMEAGCMPINKESFRLIDLANDAVATIAPQLTLEHMSISIKADEALAMEADRGLIRRVMVNLLGNAVKHSPRNGVITVKLCGDGQWVRVEVMDQGRGIPEAYQSKIFEKYGQLEARRDGLQHSVGLGLAFCKMAVETHGGSIGVSSQPGKGSCVWFTLPA